jgi:hypothetical protein
LGNNAAAQLLEPELKQYKYSSNLAALRYLVDSYEPEFWNGTMYNGWLEMIRRLNPPQNRSQLPPFMQTAAWWQEKMTTQLSSWAQLRHDNLLYAKQSYTGGVICSYPYSYVEPIPEFYDALKQFAQKAETQFDLLPFDDIYMKQAMVGYFSNMQATADTLSGIARKTLTSSQFTAEEIKFLKRMLFSTPMCGKFYDGWYISLFYRGEDWAFKKDMVVADVHTAPTDEFGNSVGWVVHAGTGPINLAVVIAQISDGSWVAFVGPVMSYYENVSLNFKRYTDEEWQEVYRVSIRPSYVNVYCTDSLGNSRDEGAMLMTGVVPDKDISIPSEIVLNQNYPNPFNSGTLITFSIPRKYSGLVAELKIFDIRGRVIAELLKRSLPTGNYTIRWDGRTNNSVSAPSGTYFYRLLVGGEQKTGRMLLVR